MTTRKPVVTKSGASKDALEKAVLLALTQHESLKLVTAVTIRPLTRLSTPGLPNWTVTQTQPPIEELPDVAFQDYLIEIERLRDEFDLLSD